MQKLSSGETDIPRPLPHAPTVCPVCWNHNLAPVEGVRVSVTGRYVGTASAYRCDNWHVFTVFDQV